MPYLDKEQRPELDEHINKLVDILKDMKNNDVALRLCYIIANLSWKLCGFGGSGKFRFDRLNTVMGAIEMAKLEFNRRMVEPYYRLKTKKTGDLK